MPEGVLNRQSSTAARRLLVVSLVGWVALAAASYAKGDLANNDFERLHNIWLSGAFAALFTALLLPYAALVELPGGVPRRTGWLGFAALAGLALLVFPIGSKDIFLYVFYGKVWQAYGANPHLLAPAEFAADPWYRFLREWPEAPASLYGPLFSLQMRLEYALSDGHLTVAVALQKILGAAMVGIAAWLLAFLRRDHEGGASAPIDSRWLSLWLWSPLVLFESVATPHNDVAMTVLILAACALWQRERPIPATAVLALAFWYKWYAVILVPVWLAWSLRRWGRRAWMGLAAPAIAAVSALTLLPLAGDLRPMAARALELHGVREIFPDELPPPLWLIFRAIAAAGLLSSPVGITLFNAFRAAALVAGLAWLVWRHRATRYADTMFLRDCFWSLALFFAVVPTQLWPWHLVVLCAFALATPGRGYERAALGLCAAGLLSYFVTFAYATVACGLIGAALWWMRRGRPASLTRPA